MGKNSLKSFAMAATDIQLHVNQAVIGLGLIANGYFVSEEYGITNYALFKHTFILIIMGALFLYLLFRKVKIKYFKYVMLVLVVVVKYYSAITQIIHTICNTVALDPSIEEFGPVQSVLPHHKFEYDKYNKLNIIN